MSNMHKFFICKKCGNLVNIELDKHVPLVCCGEKMHELVPNTIEASTEKHIPIVKVESDSIIVKVGSEAHPMEVSHFIQFIYIVTKKGTQKKLLDPVGDSPKVTFSLINDSLIDVYAYCNLHGLWKADVSKWLINPTR